MNISDPSLTLNDTPELAADEVQLWRVDLAAICSEEARWEKVLSADEKARASRFHFPRDRQHFVAGRALLRIILANYTKIEPGDLSFSYSEKGKPSLSPNHAADSLTFNLSHSGGIALYGFSRHRDLGVDVEQVRRDYEVDGIARRFFSECEQEQLAHLAPADRPEAFFRCWTRKEAYIKATGDGLSLPLSQFDVSLDPANTDALMATRPDPSEVAHWRLGDVPTGPGYAAAVCARGRDWKLRLCSSQFLSG
jgi:4'-phosphopantetheinyl transferase